MDAQERITSRVEARRAAMGTMDDPPEVGARLDDMEAAIADLAGRVANIEEAGVQDALATMDQGQ